MKRAAGILLLIFFLTSWPAAGGEEVRPPRLQEGPRFLDDADQASLSRAIAGSLAYLQNLPPGQEYPLCGKHYTSGDLASSLRRFSQLLETSASPQGLAAALQEEFEICQAAGPLPGQRLLATGYYEPLFPASLEKKAPYIHPLYRRPSDLEIVPSGGDRGGERLIGRRSGGELLPYWSRAEIETTRVLAGQELVYLADPLAAFVLHIQGSGRVVLPEGTVRRVQFAAKNGRPYRSIGRVLVEQGKMRLEEVDLPRILEYLRRHPAEVKAILHQNESYVFFRWGDESEAGPLGSLGVSLTPGRSVALDQRCYPPGLLCFLETRKPRVTGEGRINGWGPMQRFVLNQDSGSAIEGPGRLDFFWGNGSYAEAAAGGMKQPARLFFLVRKKSFGSPRPN